MLVSDVGACAGLAPGIHRWGAIDVEVHRDGHLGLAGTPYLAGAGHLLNRCVPIFARATGLSVTQVVPLCTSNPARILGLPARGLSVGAPADMVLFRWDGSESMLQVERVIRGGLDIRHVWPG